MLVRIYFLCFLAFVVLFPLYAELQMEEIWIVKDPSVLKVDTVSAWHTTEYYISKSTGKTCGSIESFPELNDYFGFAWGTQWWNWSHVKFDTYSNLADAQKAIEKLCEVK